MAAQTGSDRTWTVQNRGLRGLARRVRFELASWSPRFWWSGVVFGPALLLLIPFVAGPLFSAFYFTFVAGILLTLLYSATAFKEATVTLTDAGKLRQTFMMSFLRPSEYEVTVDFETVERVEMVPVLNHYTVRFGFDRFQSERTTCLVPPEYVDELRMLLQRNDVAVTEIASRNQQRSRVWGRTLVSIGSLGVLPLLLAVRWPEPGFHLWAVYGLGTLRVIGAVLGRVFE